MDLLQKEIARKRSAHTAIRPETGGKKYFRRGDMEAKRIASGAHFGAKGTGMNGMNPHLAPTSLKSVADADTSKAPTAGPSATAKPSEEAMAADAAAAAATVQMEPAEVKLRLRKLGQVVTFFAETDVQREARLRKIETTVSAEGTEGSTNIIGMLLRKEKEAALEQMPGAEKKEKKEKKIKKVDPNRVMTGENSVRAFFKRLTKDWKTDLDARPEGNKASSQGKTDTAYYEESLINMKPLYKKLKKHTLEPDILMYLQRIMQCMILRDYVKGMEVYVELTIGKAPWPMGVTSVGIHARAAREKIFEAGSTGHVLNDEEKRKYIHAVKRIMFFCQSYYPTDPSRTFEPGGMVTSNITKEVMERNLSGDHHKFDGAVGAVARTGEATLQGMKPATNMWIQKAPHPHTAAYERGGGWGSQSHHDR